MGISIKALSFVALMAAMTPAVCATDADKAWPALPVRIIVPIAAGGAIDAGARLFADGLSKKWGQPVVINALQGRK